MSKNTSLKALLLPVNAAPRIIEVENHWRSLSRAIGGEYIEVVYSHLAEEKGLVVIVDEMGLLACPLANASSRQAPRRLPQGCSRR